MAEKANTKRSGCGATGNDHFMCYLPDYHGTDFAAILQEATETLVGPLQDLNLFGLMMRRSFELIQKWEGYGINMRPTGDWNFEGHAMPNRRRYHLKYDGHNQKLALTAEALKRGVEIYNYTTIGELLCNADRKVIGAIGVDTTRELGDVTSDIWQRVFDEKMAAGTGPVYMNCSMTSEADLAHMRQSFVSEGDTSINDYLDQYQIDLRREMIEFHTYEFALAGKGLEIDEHAETSLKGLYAAGDMVGNVRGTSPAPPSSARSPGSTPAPCAKAIPRRMWKTTPWWKRPWPSTGRFWAGPPAPAGWRPTPR